MFEKVNPSHPDKVADRIAGAIVDLAYAKEEAPKVAVEVLVGHENCHVIVETTAKLAVSDIANIVQRIAHTSLNDIKVVKQDEHLTQNQADGVKCGDNGIFKGVPVTLEQAELSDIVRNAYQHITYDGKYIIIGDRIIACQSNASNDDIAQYIPARYEATINPLGYWTGGINVDTGATNRKLGSDMGDSVTGGGLHGKDLSKADVSVNIYAWLKAQKTQEPVELFCAIGDDTIDGKPYSEIVKIAKEYIDSVGGFEKFAEWGLI